MVTGPFRRRRSWLIGVSVLLAIIWATSLGLSARNVEQPPESQFFEQIYLKSVQNLTVPDQTFPDIEEDTIRQTPVLYAVTSKTCSQRCSTTCSKKCSTTRGCSSNCKKQTDGCGGGGGSSGSTSSVPPTSAAPETSVESASSMPRDGATGYTVKDIQLLLLVAGYTVDADGNMNGATQTAVVDFQQRNGLTATGVPDDALWRALCAAVSRLAGPSTSSSGDVTPSSGTGKYWINSGSNTRHNASCRYFGTTKQGYYTNEKVGKACGICGG